MRRPRLEPVAEGIGAPGRPLPPDREYGKIYTLQLRGADINDIAGAVLDKLKAAQKRREEAATTRQRQAADERCRHWSRLYQRLMP